MRKDKYIYQQIISEKLGKEYIIRVNIIKEEQCIYCKLHRTKKCRLKIEKNNCINFLENKTKM